MQMCEMTLARLEDTVRRGHELTEQIKSMSKSKKGTDQRRFLKSLKKERNFLLRESRRLVSTLLDTEESKRVVSEVVYRATCSAKSTHTDTLVSV